MKIVIACVAVVVLACGLYVLYTNDPSVVPIYPRCPSKLLTGYDCPGCGTTRCLYALLHGQVAEAWAFNPFVFFAIPLLLLIFLTRRLNPRHSLYRAVHHPAFPLILLVLLIPWTIYRNLPQ